MPTKVNLELIMVWFCVGFFTGAGWAVATWLVGRILGLNSSINRQRLSPADVSGAIHSITSSARVSSLGGISSPIALAVLRLMTSSN